MSATVITGNAKATRNCTTNDIQVKIGMRMSDMPGARMLMIVVMKLNAAASDEIPRICRPSTQKSMLIWGEYALVLSGAYPNQPPFGARPRTMGNVMNRPPSR